MVHYDTSMRIDINAGWKEDRIHFQDSCYQYSCYEWDYKCLLNCEGSNWEYAPLILTQNAMALASSTSTFNPYDMTNEDYYSLANNEARYNYCKSLCHGDFDCKFYCSNMKYNDSSARVDVRLGNKQASQGWYPANKCETWKRQGQWWNGYGTYAGGCYEWDFAC